MNRILLFRSYKEWAWLLLCMILIFCLSLSLEYKKYLQFKSKNSHVVTGMVENSYFKLNKNNKKYMVLKIKTNKGYVLYTTSYKQKEIIPSFYQIKLVIYPKNVSFKDFISHSFYSSSYIIENMPPKESIKYNIATYITNQHENTQLGDIYKALFLATPIDKDTRHAVLQWGISHLIAISGFHLGVLFGALYWLLLPCYRFFQQRYFPYRLAFFDIGIFVFLLMIFYAYLIDFTPSFLRALCMGIIGFLFTVLGVRVISFSTLLLSVLLLLSFFPYLIFSIGFLLSVSGVFFIYLFLHHFKELKSWQSTLLINIWVFVLMLPIVHFYFPFFSYWQFFAIPLSLVFVIFYPLVFVLHIFEIGYLFDFLLEKMLIVDVCMQEIKTSFAFVVTYTSFSLLAIKSKKLAIFIFFFIVAYFFYMQYIAQSNTI